MNGDREPIKSIIEEIVRREIEHIVAEVRDTVREAVEKTLLPELRAAVRDSISAVMEKPTQPAVQEPVPTPPKSDKDLLEPRYSARAALRPVPGPSECSLRSTEPVTSAKSEEPGGRYLYCIAPGNQSINFGKIGIEGNEVYTIPYKDLCAVVHNCPTTPYQSEDDEVVKEWIRTHQNVVDMAWEQFGTILPSGFDTIIEPGEDGRPPEKALQDWLKKDYEHLEEKLKKFTGKAEYGVQISWDPKIMGHKIAQTNEEIKNLDEEIKSKPKGMAYMYKQKLENALKKEMEKEADRCFKELFERVRRCVDDVRVEKTKKAEEGKQMLMNLSCLADKDEPEELGEELEKISAMEGFFVRFTGPWPPYSFVRHR